MKKDKLEKANKLDKEINKIQREIGNWKRAVGITRIVGERPYYLNPYIPLEPEYIDFPTLKANTIANLEAKLKQLEQELESL